VRVHLLRRLAAMALGVACRALTDMGLNGTLPARLFAAHPRLETLWVRRGGAS
jgi:hypothetical protein